MGDVAADGQARGRVSAAAFGLLLGGWLVGAVAGRVSFRTGVSDTEAYGSVPRDDLIEHPMVECTRGITVSPLPSGSGHGWPRWATAAAAGTPRSGSTYSPTGELFGQRTRFPSSADRLLPEYEDVAVGDIICDGPNYASDFRVQLVDPPHALVRTRANCSPPDVLSLRRHGRANHRGGAERVRHRAADRVRGKACLLA